jgi:hypothetical protein
VRIQEEWKVSEVDEPLATTLRIELASRRVSANDLRDFDIDQIGRVQGLSRVEYAPFDCCRRRRSVSSMAEASTTITGVRVRRGSTLSALWMA